MTKEKTLYAVIDLCDDGYVVKAVFNNKERAERYMKKHPNPKFYCSLQIREFILNKE